MFLRRFTDYILQSRLQAFLVAFVVAFIPVIGSISVVIAALVTLRKGVFDGALVVIAATLPYLISYVAYPPTGAGDVAIVAMVVLLVSNILTWLFAVFLRRYNHWSFTLEIAALVGIAIVCIAHFINPDIQDWWQAQLTAYLAKTTTMVGAIKPDAEATAAQAELINMMKRYTTGLLSASILFNALLQLLVARWWQALMFNPGGLQKELHRIRLSYVSGVIFLLGVALSYMGNLVALDCMPVLFLTFFVAGLSLVHYLIAPSQFGWMLLGLVYIAVIWLFPASIVIVSLIALFDVALNIRQRIKRSI